MEPETIKMLQSAAHRTMVIVLGGILLAAAVVKGIDLQIFAMQIRQYGILPDITGLTHGAAWGMVVVEAVIGAALLVNWRPRLMLAGFCALMLFFIAALIWAIVQGGVADCGCFGPAAQRSPREALVEDIVLLLIAVAAWRLRPEEVYFRKPLKTWAVTAVCVLAMILPLTVGKGISDQSPTALEEGKGGSGLVLESLSGERVDMSAGTFLLALMSTDCAHCRESVPLLNEIVAEVEDAFSICGVTANEQSEVDRFIEENFAFYPVLNVDTKRFSSLMSDGPLPQFILIRDGRIVSRWQGEVPPLQALMDLAATSQGA
jgi:hypothetical protein